MKRYCLMPAFSALILLAACSSPAADRNSTDALESTGDNLLNHEQAQVAPASDMDPRPADSDFDWHMKLVNEDASDADLDRIASLGINIIEGEWGMDDLDASGTLALLERIERRKMKLIMNFSDDAAWKRTGSHDNGSGFAWQKERVVQYVRVIKDSPALYGYDISNEAGENLSGAGGLRLSIDQIKTASEDVRKADPDRPVVMRMHFWDAEDSDFGQDNPFAPAVADIVLLNLYSNYTQDGASPLLPNMVAESGKTLAGKVRSIDPGVRIWISLAAFREDPDFLTPEPARLASDIIQARKTPGISGIGFFGWGPERYPESGLGWYLPRDGNLLLEIIQKSIDSRG